MLSIFQEFKERIRQDDGRLYSVHIGCKHVSARGQQGKILRLSIVMMTPSLTVRALAPIKTTVQGKAIRGLKDIKKNCNELT